MKHILSLCLLLLAATTAIGQNKDLTNELITLPSGTIYDKLDNGLHYIVKPNDLPGNKIEFRLMIKAGSIYETEEQRGCAHFLEHMAFKGTKHFPKRGIIEYLESIGVTYGFGINAVTGYDRTIYMFSMPTDNPKDLEKGLVILKDWLTNITIDPVDVESEKGVILEEARGYDLGDVFYDLKVGENRYANRMPLGSMDQIRSITPEKLRGFYKEWYTTQLATVVLVGDLDSKQAVSTIKKVFADVPASKSPNYKDMPLEYPKKITYAEYKDTVTNKSSLEIIIPHKCVNQHIYGDILKRKQARMLIDALSQRFRDKKIKAALSNTWYLSDKDHLVLSVSEPTKTEVANVVSAAVSVINELIKDGLSEDEMEDLKYNLTRNDRSRYFAKASDQWCEDFTDLVLTNERYPSDSTHYGWLDNQINATTGKTLQNLAGEWFSDLSTMLISYRYNPKTDSSFTTDQIVEAWDKGQKAEYKKYAYTKKERTQDELVVIPHCISKKISPADNMIKKQKYVKELNITDITLKNGARLIFKPTKDEDKQISMTSFAPGGLSQIPAQDYAMLEGVAGYMEMGGIEKMDYDTYSAMISQEKIALTISMEQCWHGLSATAPAGKSTELCNLIYEKCFFPEKRYDDFNDVKEDMLKSLGEETILTKLLKTDVDRLIVGRIDKLMGNSLSAGKEPQTPEEIKQLDLDQIADFYKTIYTNPNQMTFIICGNFDVEKVKTDFIGMLAKFPSNSSKSKYLDSKFQLPTTIHMEAFNNDNPTQTVFDYLFHGEYKPGLKNTLLLKMSRDVVRSRLLSELRQKESLIYSPYISLYYNGAPNPIFYFDINGSVDTENTAKVEAIIMDIIKDVQQNPIDENELKALQRSFVVTKRESLNEYATSTWKKYLTTSIRNGETIDEMAHYQKILYSITTKDIMKACREYFNFDNYVLLHKGAHKSNTNNLTGK